MRSRRARATAVGCAIAVFLALAGNLTSATAAELAPTALPSVPGSESEPNDNAATASPIASGERIRGSVFPGGDADFYQFSAQAGARVFAAVMTSASSSASLDSQLTLLNSDGVTSIELDEDDGFHGSAASSIAGATLPAAGVYYLKVNHKSGTGQLRPYDLYLQLRATSSPNESEANNEVAAANPLNGSVAGVVDPAADADFYSIPLSAGDTVFLSLDLNPERDATTFNGRLGIGLFGTVGNQFLSVDDPSTADANPSEAQFMTVNQSGTYYVRVDSALAVGGPTATYSLSATVLPASQPSCRSYSAGPLIIPTGPATVSLPIPVADAARIGRAAMAFNLTHTFISDLDASLKSPNGTEFPVFTDIGPATVGGPETTMEAVFDDFAAIPSSYTVSRGMMWQPELNSRFDWFEGMEAAGAWELVVRDDATGDGGTLNEAKLILCPEPPEGASKQLYSANFESGAEGFTHSGTLDEWELGLPATLAAPDTAPLGTCAQGSSCWKTDLDGAYEASSNQDLFSPPIALPAGGGKLYASWEQWYQMESATFDHASVSIEEVGGIKPRPLFTWLGATMSTGVGNPTVTFETGAGWGIHRAEISDYAGKTIQLRFHLDSDTTEQRTGLGIDAVRIYQLPEVSPPAKKSPGGAVASNLSGLAIKPASFRAAPSGPSATSSAKSKGKGKGQKKGPTGTTATYTNSQAATATLTVLKLKPGRKAKGKCLKPTRTNRKAPRCNRETLVGSFTHTDVAGLNKLKFTGRINNRKLTPGKYILKVQATAPGAAPSNVLTAPFKIIR